MKKFRYLTGLLVGLMLFGCCTETAAKTESDNVKILASFENGSSRPFVASVAQNAKVDNSKFATDGKKALLFKECYVSWDQANQDWTKYDFIAVDAYLEGDKPINFGVELRDKATHDYWTRVNYDSVLMPGANTIRIPLDIKVGGKSRPGRQYQKNAVTRVVFVANAKDKDTKYNVHLDNVRVEVDTSDNARFEGLHSFSFGDASAPLMGGFIRVDRNTIYTKERGFGFLHGNLYQTQDAFQPDILYRSNISIVDNSFIVDLPNGKYHVFINIDGAAGYWGQQGVYHNRQVLANGKMVVDDKFDREKAMERQFRFADTEDLYTDNIFDKYVTPRYNEKEFDVTVTDGKLTLEFKGENYAIALSALIIYPADKTEEGKAYLANVLDRRRADFDGYFHKIVHVDDNPEPLLNDAQHKQGFVFFARPPEKNIYPNTKPLSNELVDSVSARGAAGTIEPMTFAIRSYKDFGNVKVNVSDFVSESGAVIPASAIKVSYVSNRLTRSNYDGTEYGIAPRYLMNFAEIDFPNETSRWFWANFNTPSDTPKGVYAGRFELAFSNGESAVLPATFEVVYDKALPPLDIPAGPWGFELRLPWYHNEMTNFYRKLDENCLKIMRESGITTFSVGVNIKPIGQGKDMVFDFSNADYFMKIARENGILGIVNYGGSFVRGMNVYGYSNPTDPAKFGFESADAMWKHVVEAIDKHAVEKNWLPLFVTTSDEPHVKSDREKNLTINAILKKYATPRIRFAGAISLAEHDKDSIMQDLACSMDIANVNGHDQWAIDTLHKADSDWAFYNGGNRWTFGAYMYMLAQKNKMLFRPAWHWNAATGDPYFALDGREDDFCWVNANAKGELVTSLKFEQLRRGIVDYRYLLALKALIEQDPDNPAAKDAHKLLDEVLELKPGVDRNADKSQSIRDRAIEILKSAK